MQPNLCPNISKASTRCLPDGFSGRKSPARSPEIPSPGQARSIELQTVLGNARSFLVEVRGDFSLVHSRCTCYAGSGLKGIWMLLCWLRWGIVSYFVWFYRVSWDLPAEEGTHVPLIEVLGDESGKRRRDGHETCATFRFVWTTSLHYLIPLLSNLNITRGSWRTSS